MGLRAGSGTKRSLGVLASWNGGAWRHAAAVLSLAAVALQLDGRGDRRGGRIRANDKYCRLPSSTSFVVRRFVAVWPTPSLSFVCCRRPCPSVPKRPSQYWQRRPVPHSMPAFNRYQKEAAHLVDISSDLFLF
jgi:hypothetical protein